MNGSQQQTRYMEVQQTQYMEVQHTQYMEVQHTQYMEVQHTQYMEVQHTCVLYASPSGASKVTFHTLTAPSYPPVTTVTSTSSSSFLACEQSANKC
jgi:hypothetical protein